MSNVNANGYCSDCTYYHNSTVSCQSATEPQLPAHSVNELLKRNPVTGKIEVTSLEAKEVYNLLVSEGWSIWPTLGEAQRSNLHDYLFDKFVEANTIENKFAKRLAKGYFANFLIDMKKDRPRKEITA